tara:strand:+ start:206 stop:592 length:387 start_codon:yes stop_codon:yes gene_type:complete
MKKKYLFVLPLLIFFFEVIYAVEPDEILDNENLENIAREIGKELRCMVCQNEDIENSNADIARDLRLLVRMKLSKGESKKEIINYIHSRYGDYILFSPPLKTSTIALWAIPLIFTIFLTLIFFKRKKK